MKNYITHDSAENLHQSENLNQQAEPKEPPTVLWILCTAVNIWSGSKKFIKFALKAIAHWVRNFRMRFSVFSYSSSFPIKMNATDAKTQKIEPDPNFLWRTKVSEAVCKRDCHNVRSYLFFNMRIFRTKISDSVCRDLKGKRHRFSIFQYVLPST